jgi:hypothetical protein
MQTPAQVAAKFASNLGSATTSIQNGVQAVTQSPTAAAANAVTKWQQKMAQPSTASKFVAGLNGVSLQSWQSAMINKGLPRIASGAQAAIPKMTAFYNDFLPFVAGVQAKVKAMPSLTLTDSANRMLANMNAIAAYKKPAGS